MALVLTDGTQTPEPSPEEADESLFAAAQLLHDKGIDVLAIGIGRDVNPFQLLTIASDENNLYVARVFDEILDVVGDLTQRECLGRSKFMCINSGYYKKIAASLVGGLQAGRLIRERV